MIKEDWDIELYLTSPDSLEKAHLHYGGSQGLLRCAAQSVADAGFGVDGASPAQSVDDEVCALRKFAFDSGLLMHPASVERLLERNPMRGGKEHRVGYLAEAGRVIKDADVHALATESLYDYMTDMMLSNALFDDDLQLVGFYHEGPRLHLVSSQPYVNGTHPDWVELKACLVAQGLRDPYPALKAVTLSSTTISLKRSMSLICTSTMSSVTQPAGYIPSMHTSILRIALLERRHCKNSAWIKFLGLLLLLPQVFPDLAASSSRWRGTQ